MTILAFEELIIKIEKIIEKYDSIKKDKDKIEHMMLIKEKENQEIKKQLEIVLRERENMRRKLDAIVEKIDSLELQ
jgi:hypothetical protein